MKTIFSIIFFGLFIISDTTAQNSTVKPAFALGVVTPPSNAVGTGNYLFSFSEPDFKNKTYVFFTDSNATVAYVNINGNILRLTGGANPEHIMAYTCKGYTVTLSRISTNSGQGNSNTIATLVIYNGMGNALVKKVVGTQLNARQQ